MKTFIVKVQTPIITNSQSAICLVYDEARSIMNEFPLSKEIRKMMKGENKKFFNATIKNKLLLLIDEAEWQDW